MVPFPNVPTDSLYKFLALGGVIALLTVFVLFITETEKIKADDISLRNNTEVINLKISNLNEEIRGSNASLKKDSLDNEKEKKLMKLNTGLREKLGLSTLIEFGDKNITYEQYEKTLSDDYTKSLKRYNAHIASTNKLIEAIPFEKLKIKKQEELLKQNKEYYDSLYYSTYAIFLFGVLFSAYGFRKWHYLQCLSDELSRLQLDKTRKEVNGDKPKLITV